jgi:hypothetical protein
VTRRGSVQGGGVAPSVTIRVPRGDYEMARVEADRRGVIRGEAVPFTSVLREAVSRGLREMVRTNAAARRHHALATGVGEHSKVEEVG